ncbi:MarR family transcriptional regulator [Sphingopyxis sp. KK2]|uniref:MarR family transcriptional regulator n=1 Tax=Sphingopyxis sp. KK2 TaxID=1855727 RepID=UPI0015C39D0F|nr:MarR family transcriptional regulator [Sphingopyxis sp. KK2]
MMDQMIDSDQRIAAPPPERFDWVPPPHGPDGHPAAVLFVGPRSIGADLMRSGRARVIDHIPAARVAAHLRTMALPDIVWLIDTETIEVEVLSEICDAAIAMECALVCETALGALDRVAAIVPAAIRTEWLVDADAADRLVALAAASRSQGAAVHDVARDDAMERIDRLQDEVARIARLLGDLSGQRGLPGTPPAFVPRDEDFGDAGGQVRAPVRDYAAPPRSFEPDERMVHRQRAKAVRRMLRQRRMREQYFPADLFADPAWDMLLDLYAARLERQPVSVSSLCIAAAVPATTALRWIKTMTDAGLFLREADPHDGRRIFIGLAEAAFDALARYFEALEE